MRKPLVVVLNRVDAAEAAGITVNANKVAARLGCPVMPVVAVSNQGIDALKKTLADAVASLPVPSVEIGYDATLESAIAELVSSLVDASAAEHANPRWLASRLLEGDDLARRIAADAVSDERLEQLRDTLPDDVGILLADGRYGFANRINQQTVKRKSRASRNFSDGLDRIMLNRALGIPIFLGVMYLMFMFTINIGGAFIDFFDQFTGALLVDGVAGLMGGLGSPDWLTVLVANGIGGGIQVVATFIPVIAFLYLFLSVLEDSGYMARAAFVMDRFMREEHLVER